VELMQRGQALVIRRFGALRIWHEFSWLNGCGNSPSVIGLRASPADAGFHRGRNCSVIRKEFAKISTSSIRIRFANSLFRVASSMRYLDLRD